MEMIKKPIKVGNSVGVLIPKMYKDSLVSVKILQPKPLIEEIMKILSNKINVSEIRCIMLVGSYVTGEFDKDSDFDILVITSNTNKYIKEGRYEILCYREKGIYKTSKDNFLVKQMIKEGKSLLNNSLVNELRKIKVTKNEKQVFYSETKKILTELKRLLQTIEVDYQGTQNLIVYSCILRLKTILYLKNKYSKKNLIKLVKKKEIYSAYRKIKNRKDYLKIINKKDLNYLIKLLEKYSKNGN